MFSGFFNSIFGGVFSGIIAQIVALILGALMLSGCAIILEDDGEVGIGWEVGLRAYHTSPETPDNPGSHAEIGVITPMLEEVMETMNKDRTTPVEEPVEEVPVEEVADDEPVDDESVPE